MLRLLTNEEVIRLYGDPAQSLDDAGTPTLEWQSANLASFNLDRPLPLAWGGNASRITCHAAVRDELSGVFQKLYALPNVWATIGDYGGCFNFRRNTNNRQVLSRHSWGIAIDLDTLDNPNGQKLPHVHPLIIQAFYDAGWYWGGWFTKPDPMHFEKGVKL